MKNNKDDPGQWHLWERGMTRHMKTLVISLLYLPLAICIALGHRMGTDRWRVPEYKNGWTARAFLEILHIPSRSAPEPKSGFFQPYVFMKIAIDFLFLLCLGFCFHTFRVQLKLYLSVLSTGCKMYACFHSYQNPVKLHWGAVTCKNR